MCVISVVGCAAAINAQSFDHSYAVVIGINDYEYPSRWPNLKYPENDAKAFAKFLTGQGFLVKQFYGQAATRLMILSYMEDTLARVLTSHDRVLVFFAGHGYTEKLGGKDRGYIVPYDGGTNSTLISMDDLEAISSYMDNARHQLFMLDSCFGGLLEHPRDSVVDPMVPNYLINVTQRVARQALTAGGANQQVLDTGPDGHSVFMDAVLSGLRDGNADLNGDGYITFSELAAFVVPKASNRYQTPAPGYLPGHELGEFWFRSPKGRTATISNPVEISSGGLRGAESDKISVPSTAEKHSPAGDIHAENRQIPEAGPVSIVANVPATEHLTLNSSVLVDIYLGKISNWNDLRIAKNNPAIKLPDRRIIVVHRSESNETTRAFTEYLAEISREWKDGPGNGATINWPVGVGGKGDQGVAGLVSQLPGAIGYVDRSYAEQNHLNLATVKKVAGD